MDLKKLMVFVVQLLIVLLVLSKVLAQIIVDQFVKLMKFGIQAHVVVNLISIESMDNVHNVHKVFSSIKFVSILDLHIMYLFLFI